MTETIKKTLEKKIMLHFGTLNLLFMFLLTGFSVFAVIVFRLGIFSSS